MSEEVIVKAARWWAARLRSEVGLGDNGARDMSNATAIGMTSIIRKRHPVSEQHALRFEEDLRRRIGDALLRVCEYESRWPRELPDVGCNWYFDNSGWNNGGPDLCLAVDYHPCPLLLRALEVAGVERNVREVAALPLKTIMRVSLRRAIVAHGYGAPFVDLVHAWGCSYEEQARADQVRDDMGAAAYEAWRADERQGAAPQWQGPIPG